MLRERISRRTLAIGAQSGHAFRIKRDSHLFVRPRSEVAESSGTGTGFLTRALALDPDRRPLGRRR